MPPIASAAEERTQRASPEEYSLVVNCSSGIYVVPLGGAGEVLIGRDPSCDVVVADDSVSRKHARLSFGESIHLEDLGSRNGTSVLGRPVEAGQPVVVSESTFFQLGSASFALQRVPRGSRHAPAAPPPRRSLPPARDDSGVIVHDAAMRNAYDLLEAFAPSPLSVVILGETGVGKDLYAQAVHQRSQRSHKPMLQLNCAALPESILEGELFGYEKGAFTGATQAKPGLFESADGGTVFLDEIGELPAAIQAKLLRVIENGQVMRLGSVRPKTVDVRFVSATNRDLRAAQAQGQFRPDLFFRLNGISVTLPPLRSRIADIAPLARRFASQAAAAQRKQLGVTDAAVRALERYAWPGNVRELKNVIDRSVLLCRQALLDVEHIAMAAPEVMGPSRDEAGALQAEEAPTGVTSAMSDLRGEWRAQEAKVILDALNRSAWHQGEAAKLLGISRHTMIRRMRQFGIQRPHKTRSDGGSPS